MSTNLQHAGENELPIMIVADNENGYVRIEIGKFWLNLEPELALDFASIIVSKAAEVNALHKPQHPVAL